MHGKLPPVAPACAPQSPIGGSGAWGVISILESGCAYWKYSRGGYALAPQHTVGTLRTGEGKVFTVHIMLMWGD